MDLPGGLTTKHDYQHMSYIIFFEFPCKIFHIVILAKFAEGEFFNRKINCGSKENDLSSFYRDIHGAPPESLVVKLAEVIGNFKNLREMAMFWCKVVVEVCMVKNYLQFLYFMKNCYQSKFVFKLLVVSLFMYVSVFIVVL